MSYEIKSAAVFAIAATLLVGCAEADESQPAGTAAPPRQAQDENCQYECLGEVQICTATHTEQECVNTGMGCMDPPELEKDELSPCIAVYYPCVEWQTVTVCDSVVIGCQTYLYTCYGS
jgi:hypothetical protein